jgi:hypothetical protein
VSVAFENPDKGRKGTDFVAIVAGQDAGDLMEMGQIVSGPGGEEF